MNKKIDEKIEFVDLKKQYELHQKEIDAAMSSVVQKTNFIMGSEVEDLEHMLCEYTGSQNSISCSSGTSAIEIALRAFGIGFGDEVITTPFTWISSAEVISLVGAKPVFCDIDLGTFNISPDEIEKRITPKTKAVIAVSLYGQTANLQALKEICTKHKLHLIEDAAQSFGARHHNKLSCNIAECSTTSFFPAKALGCYGDGGAIFTNDKALAEKIRAIRLHGGHVRNFHTEVGTNGRLDTIQAAILIEKLKFFDKELIRRKEIADYYERELSPKFETPFIESFNDHSFSVFTLKVDNRQIFRDFCKDRGVPTAVYYPKCLHEQPVYNYLGHSDKDFPNALLASRSVISLPIHPYLTDIQVEYIVETLNLFK